MDSPTKHLKPSHVYALCEDDFDARDALLAMLCSTVDYLGTSTSGLGYTWPVFNAMNDALDACRLGIMQPRFILFKLHGHGPFPDDADAIAEVLHGIRNEVLEYAARGVAEACGLEPRDGEQPD